ncbi:MAG: serine/threonine protein kinase [Aeromicrobium sp.]|nr:serine/threonine protein kinase [Burkholderiales bacterium]
MPQHLGKYRIDAVLGTGAMGVVYKGFDLNIARVVAIKTIRKELLIDEDSGMVARFKNEAQAAGRLTHPNIVSVYDYGEDTHSAYLAMEFVDGVPLNTLMVADAPTETARALDWIAQLLGALDYAHVRGVVHRDVKPANLLITRDAQLKITDFGIARIESSNLTQIGSMMGTPSFMSPEQYRGETADRRSDVFSAAVVAYQLLTGRRPFAGPIAVVMQKILNDTPTPASQVNPVLSPAYDAMLERALAKSPAHRYQSARAFLDALMVVGATDFGSSGSASTTVPLMVDQDATRLVNATEPTHSSPPVSFTTGTFTAPMWLGDALPAIEAGLARQIGPMAKLLLKKIAFQVTSIEGLRAALLPHIPSKIGQEQFVSMLENIKLGTAAMLGQETNTIAREFTPAATSAALDDEFTKCAERALTALIGPIAKILVKRAVRAASDRVEFLSTLCASLETEHDRTQFMAAIALR